MVNKIMLTGRVCSDIYCRPFINCSRRQFMPVFPAHIVVLEHIAGDNTYRYRYFFPGFLSDNLCFKLWEKLSPATEYVIYIKTNSNCKLYYSTRNVNLYISILSYRACILFYRAFILSYRACILSGFPFILSW